MKQNEEVQGERVETCWMTVSDRRRCVQCSRTLGGWVGGARLFAPTVGVQQLLGALDRLEPKLKKRQHDLQFLRGLLRSSDFNILMKVRAQ